MGSAAHGHELTAKEMYIAHTASRHPFHVLPPSPWPILASGGTMVTMLGEPLTSAHPRVYVCMYAGEEGETVPPPPPLPASCDRHTCAASCCLPPC